MICWKKFERKTFLANNAKMSHLCCILIYYFLGKVARLSEIFATINRYNTLLSDVDYFC